MQSCRRTDMRAGVTLKELIIVVVTLAVLMTAVSHYISRAKDVRGEAPRIRCRNNLNQLAKGMATYLAEHGDGRWYPCPLGRGKTPADYNGAEWLASLYWTGVISDPGVFICPASEDSNEDGLQLGADRAVAGLFGSQTVSYAGLHYKSLLDEQGGFAPAIAPTDYPPNKIMASDDTQGDINHGVADNGGMAILFFDSHVEFRTSFEMDIAISVGSTAGDGLLRDLRN